MKRKPNESWTRKCDFCGREYTVKVEWQRFCGIACRLAAWAKRQGEKK